MAVLFCHPLPKMAKPVLSVHVSGFRWKVENALSRDGLLSDEFVLGECRWRLRLRLSSSCYFAISLDKLNPEKLNWRYKIQAFIEDRNEKPVNTRDHVLEDPDFTSRDIWWIRKDELQRQRDAYLTDGTLTFVIVFTVTRKPEMDAVGEKVSGKSSQTLLNMDSVADIEHLSLDLRRLLDDGVQSDVTLKCGELSFPAHKAILSARSEVFSAMFRSDMAESRTGVIQISDVDASVLDQFLRYLYSGKLFDLSVDTASKLYAAADKYSVEPLKESSAKFMEGNLTMENACRILVLADAHEDERLKDSVLCFITSIELLRNKDVWWEFHNEHPKLAGEAAYHAYEAKCVVKEIVHVCRSTSK